MTGFEFSKLKGAVAALALGAVFAASGAQAATHVLNLTGSANDIATNSFTFDGSLYETGVLELTGFTPFQLADGDDVEVTITITDGAFTLPVRDFMFFGLNFSDISGGAQPTTSSSTGNFSFDGGPDVGAGCGNCTSLITGVQSLSFSSLFATGAFTMDSPYQINSITVSYQVNNAAVPEPGTWALMIAGFGGAGMMIRRRRRSGDMVAA